jgi:hypothetical protein
LEKRVEFGEVVMAAVSAGVLADHEVSFHAFICSFSVRRAR